MSTLLSGLSLPLASVVDPAKTFSYIIGSTQIFTVPISGGTPSVLAGQAGVLGYADGTGSQVQFWNPNDAAVHPRTGVLYLVDGTHRIRVCTSLGVVTTLAGCGERGNVDGAAFTAKFNWPTGIVLDSSSVNLYVTCLDGNTLRQVVVLTGWVTTLAGSGGQLENDGTGPAASFNQPAYVICSFD